jgi:hypothetical protein
LKIYLDDTPDYQSLKTNQIIDELQRMLEVPDLSSKTDLIQEYLWGYEVEVIDFL